MDALSNALLRVGPNEFGCALRQLTSAELILESLSVHRPDGASCRAGLRRLGRVSPFRGKSGDSRLERRQVKRLRVTQILGAHCTGVEPVSLTFRETQAQIDSRDYRHPGVVDGARTKN